MNFTLGKAIGLLATMRLGLSLIAIIIVLSVVGTLIPQERQITAGPILTFFYHTLGFGNLYHSMWFSSLLFLLCLNLVCCSVSRLPALWRETFATPSWPASLAWQREELMAAPPGEAAGRVRQYLEKAGFSVRDMGDNRLLARKGQLAPWGTFLVHVSILIIALGGFYGSLAGFQYSVMLSPGEAITVGTSAHPGVGRPFELRLNSFTTELYQSGQVSDWISNLTITQGGVGVHTQDVKVNHPLSYQSMSFYQASYANLYVIDLRTAGRSERKIRAEEKQPVILDEHQGVAVVPLKYLPEFDPQRPMVSRSNQPLNPHVIYMAYSGGRPLGMNAVPLGKPLTLPGSPSAVVFTAVQDASGLDVKHDPGLPLVFTGFSIMSAAFFMSLFPHRRVVWAEIRPAGESAVVGVSLFGRSRPVPEALDRLCQSLAAPERK